MLALEYQIASVVIIALILYVLFGGADFGGGVWDLFATGPRAKAQRHTISKAIAPVWETNHIWIILVIVLLFVGFPQAFAAISTALHIPLTLMLIGIVLRGSAFAFRSYGIQSSEAQDRWSLVFSISSVITPITLGMIVGALTSGTLQKNPRTGLVQTDFVSSWLAPFPIALGFFTLTLFSFLAAVYLCLETTDKDLQEDFRKRALASGATVGVMAWICFWLSSTGAPLLRKGLSQSAWSLPFQILTGLVAVATFVLLWKRKYLLARIFAAGQVTLIMIGWALAQFPYIIIPHWTFKNTASPESVLRPIMITLLIGLVVLIPALWYLFSIFKQDKKSTS